MEKDLIVGIIYVQFLDIEGTSPLVCVPDSTSEKIQMLIGIKSVSLLTGEGEYIPKSLVFIPLPSLNLKCVVKYVKWADETRRGGFARSSLSVIFKESDDLIFYHYKEDLDDVFENFSQSIIELELKKADKEKFDDLISVFNSELVEILENLRKKELMISDSAIEVSKDAIIKNSRYVFKVITCGEAMVGKTSIILRFTDHAFERKYLATLGVNITEKMIIIDGATVQLMLWDVAGQKKFKEMRKHFFSGSDWILLVFDLTKPKSFQNLKTWYQDISKTMKTEKHVLKGHILGNKSDLLGEKARNIAKESVLEFAKKINFEYIETSALTGANIEDTFHNISKTLIDLKKKKT